VEKRSQFLMPCFRTLLPRNLSQASSHFSNLRALGFYAKVSDTSLLHLAALEGDIEALPLRKKWRNDVRKRVLMYTFNIEM
jgi:hypothetical protein